MPFPDTVFQLIPILAGHRLGRSTLQRFVELGFECLLGLALLDLADDRAEVLADRAESLLGSLSLDKLLHRIGKRNVHGSHRSILLNAILTWLANFAKEKACSR
jgi:hypothetical protein